MATQPEHYERHYQDETPLETNPHLSRVWHRRGVQPTVPAVGTNRRLTAFGSVEACGRGRGEVLCAEQTSAAFLSYLAALEERPRQRGRQTTWSWITGRVTPARPVARPWPRGPPGGT